MERRRLHRRRRAKEAAEPGARLAEGVEAGAVECDDAAALLVPSDRVDAREVEVAVVAAVVGEAEAAAAEIGELAAQAEVDGGGEQRAWRDGRGRRAAHDLRAREHRRAHVPRQRALRGAIAHAARGASEGSRVARAVAKVAERGGERGAVGGGRLGPRREAVEVAAADGDERASLRGAAEWLDRLEHGAPEADGRLRRADGARLPRGRRCVGGDVAPGSAVAQPAGRAALVVASVEAGVGVVGGREGVARVELRLPRQARQPRRGGGARVAAVVFGKRARAAVAEARRRHVAGAVEVGRAAVRVDVASVVGEVRRARADDVLPVEHHRDLDARGVAGAVQRRRLAPDDRLGPPHLTEGRDGLPRSRRGVGAVEAADGHGGGEGGGVAREPPNRVVGGSHLHRRLVECVAALVQKHALRQPGLAEAAVHQPRAALGRLAVVRRREARRAAASQQPLVRVAHDSLGVAAGGGPLVKVRAELPVVRLKVEALQREAAHRPGRDRLGHAPLDAAQNHARPRRRHRALAGRAPRGVGRRVDAVDARHHHRARGRLGAEDADRVGTKVPLVERPRAGEVGAVARARAHDVAVPNVDDVTLAQHAGEGARQLRQRRARLRLVDGRHLRRAHQVSALPAKVGKEAAAQPHPRAALEGAAARVGARQPRVTRVVVSVVERRHAESLAHDAARADARRGVAVEDDAQRHRHEAVGEGADKRRRGAAEPRRRDDGGGAPAGGVAVERVRPEEAVGAVEASHRRLPVAVLVRRKRRAVLARRVGGGAAEPPEAAPVHEQRRAAARGAAEGVEEVGGDLVPRRLKVVEGHVEGGVVVSVEGDLEGVAALGRGGRVRGGGDADERLRVEPARRRLGGARRGGGALGAARRVVGGAPRADAVLRTRRLGGRGARQPSRLATQPGAAEVEAVDGDGGVAAGGPARRRDGGDLGGVEVVDGEEDARVGPVGAVERHLERHVRLRLEGWCVGSGGGGWGAGVWGSGSRGRGD